MATNKPKFIKIAQMAKLKMPKIEEPAAPKLDDSLEEHSLDGLSDEHKDILKNHLNTTFRAANYRRR